jgi:hypothetical protein
VLYQINDNSEVCGLSNSKQLEELQSKLCDAVNKNNDDDNNNNNNNNNYIMIVIIIIITTAIIALFEEGN